VVAIALGGWEALSSLGGLAATSAFGQMPQFIPALELRTEDRAQLAHLQELVASTFMSPELLTLAALTLPVALFTIVAAIRLRRGKPGSARWFARAVGALAVVEVVQLVLALRLGVVLQPLFEEVLRGSVPSGADADELVRNLQSFVQLATIGGAIVGLAFGVGKVIACLYARRCARRPEVRAWTG
jgi:hypothetical protein